MLLSIISSKKNDPKFSFQKIWVGFSWVYDTNPNIQMLIQ